MNARDDFERVLAAAARLQKLVPDAVLVGGSAAAHHAGHRVSFDDDHVIADLRERFEEILDVLESDEDWKTARIRPPVLILGRLDGIETGIRQLIRRRPLEIEVVGAGSETLRVPTLHEILRIKAWLALRRNATRDYLDIAGLATRIGSSEGAGVVLGMDDYYADQLGPGGARVATQVAKQLADPQPYDLSDVDFRHYRKLERRWRDWSNVAAACRTLAADVLDLVAQE